jgi:two-component sensor histidine kinase
VNTYVPYGEQPATTGDPETLQRVQAARVRTVSNLFTSLVAKRHVFNVLLPVMRDGNLDLVMILGLLPEHLLGIVGGNLPEGWVTTVWDAHGVIIARTRDHARFIGTTVPSNLRAPAGLPSVRQTTNLDGEEVLRAVDRSVLSGWSVAVNAPASVVRAQLRDSLALWLTSLAVALALTISLGSKFGRRITGPLTAVNDAAETLGRGGTISMPPTGIREINRLREVLLNAEEELRRREKQQQLLVRELNHRVKNTLAIVQALASQTKQQNPDDFVASFENRLLALARGHDLLTEGDWTGATLREVVDTAVRPFRSDKNEIVISGDKVDLPPTAIVTLCLFLHELATNASKYGALSVANGIVKIDWTVAETDGKRVVRLAWTEANGPTVTKPRQTGFGSRLFALSAVQLDAEFAIFYEPDGVRARLIFPMP